MLTEPTRWRARPPEVDALVVEADTADSACLWLRAHGRDGFLTGHGIRVVPPTTGLLEHDQAPGFDVPFGHYLVRDPRTGGWAPVPPDALTAEYEPLTAVRREARHQARRDERRGR